MKYVSAYFSPNRGGADVLIGFIKKCQKSIDAAVYCITHDKICDALIDAHKRGVKVRVITDKTQSFGKYADAKKLEEANVPIIRGGTAWRSSMHNKFVIGDSKAVGTGSFNWTKSADKRNDENFVIIRISYVVREFQKEFDSLWSKLCKE
jgi:phosphatidylserine/phosphatidylglycerophosphate/cardiolipin synthase-like enzyme